jgi:hypothetical protein
MRDDKGRLYSESEATTRAKAFEEGIFVLENMHNRTLVAGTRREYFKPFESCSAAVTKEALRTAIQDERFFPVISTIRAHIERARQTLGQWEPAAPVVKETQYPKYTDEERSDVERMKADLNRKFQQMPWAKEAPGACWS